MDEEKRNDWTSFCFQHVIVFCIAFFHNANQFFILFSQFLTIPKPKLPEMK